jgi:5-hydroxyisourate hydrolase-like protein (transthyretin family)
MKTARRLLALCALVLLPGLAPGVLAHTLSGTVYGNGSPLADAGIVLTLAADGGSAGETTTNASGVYSLEVADGSYNLLVQPPASSGLADSRVYGIRVDGADVTQNLALVSGVSTLSGVVQQSDGTPMAGVRVELKDDATWTSLANMTTGTDGAYSFSVAPGTYRFALFRSPSYSTPLPGEPPGFQINDGFRGTVVAGPTTRDLVLPFATLSGKTTDQNGVAVGEVAVTFTDNNYHFFPGDLGNTYILYPSSTVTSDANGDYELIVFDGGSYGFRATPPADSGLAVTTFNGISTTGDTSYDFALQASVTLSGVVQQSDGTPMAGVRVELKDDATWTSLANMTTGTDGAYSFSVAPGTYRFALFRSPSYSTPLPGEPPGFQINDGFRGTVVAGPTTRDLVLPFATLSGKTTDQNGVAVGEVAVTFTDNNYHFFPGDLGNTYILYPGDLGNTYILYPSSTVTSDANGDYEIVVFDGGAYGFRIDPPSASGFATSLLNGLGVSGPTRLTVLLLFQDATAPRIISGPTVTNIVADAATVQWQTDEPTIGGADWGSGSIDETAYATQHSLAMTGLAPETGYTVTVFATDGAGNGPVSADASFTTTAAADTTPPTIIAGPTVSGLTYEGAVIEWETDESATTEIGGDLTATVAGYRTQHRVELTGLAALTGYSLTLSSSDLAGNGPTTAAVQFTTLSAPDLSAPVITKGPWVADVGANAATVAWETDEAANSGVSWNDGTTYGVYTDETLARRHQVAITGLLTDTSYAVTVSSTDGLGNGPTLSAPLTFSTLAEADTTAPVFIEPPSACAVSDRMIGVCLRTDEPASLTIDYGTDPDALTQSAARVQLADQHYLALTGLTPSTDYTLRATVRDQAGNARSSALLQVRTAATPVGPPVFLEGPTATYVGDNRVVVAWQTDRPAAALIEYEDGGETLRVEDGRLLDSHDLVVPNLDAGTDYSLRVTVTGADGQQVLTLVTATLPDLTPPTITDGPTVQALPGGLTEIAWTTDEAADSRVNFGAAPNLLNRVAGDIDYRLSHRVRLSGLVPGQVYYYQVTTVDPVGNATQSAIGDFVAEVPSFTLRVERTGSGTVSGGGVFPVDTLVAPVAEPADGSFLQGWTPNLCAAPFALTEDTTCIATFSAAQQVPGDLDGDGDMDADDYALFRAVLGSCTGADRYLAAADYDGDGCITLGDYRTWYGHYRAYLSGL